ncbi:hypothetical protein [Silicimonas sp. MF1-12-2]|uniref:hypothetical protein n=1 Tax=Silicimonas sp. MF1-12-2 TaxID=3384793 RepID=UPI0039B3A791
MKRIILGTTAACFAATAGFAAVTIQDLDVSGDSFATFEEVKNAMPKMDMVDFKAIDANSDMRLSAEEINDPAAQARLAEHSILMHKDQPIRNLDTDGDGFIGWNDMARVYPTMTRVTFQGIDSNGDNRLSYAEYFSTDAQIAIAQCSASSFQDLASLDANGDNFLSMEELKGGYPGVTAFDFQTIDLNRDNRISSVEYLAPTAQCLEGK